jgi:hypothetical protein
MIPKFIRSDPSLGIAELGSGSMSTSRNIFFRSLYEVFIQSLVTGRLYLGSVRIKS